MLSSSRMSEESPIAQKRRDSTSPQRPRRCKSLEGVAGHEILLADGVLRCDVLTVMPSCSLAMQRSPE